MAGSSLRFTVEVAADQADQTLKAMTLAFNEAGAQARIALSQIAPAAHRAGGEVGSLGEQIKAFARTQRTEGRAAGFFITEFLTPLAGSSTAAKEALTALGGALIGGTGIGVAISAVSLGTKLFGDYLEESAKAAKEAAEKHKQAAEKIQAAYEKARLELQKLGSVRLAGGKTAARPFGSEAPAAEFEAREAAAPARNEVYRLEIELEKVRAERARKEALLAYLPEGATKPRIAATQREIELVNQLAEARRKLQEIEKKGAADVKEIRTKEKKDLEKELRETSNAEYRATVEKYAKQREAREKFDEWVKQQDLERAHAKDTSGEPSVAAFGALESATVDPASMLKPMRDEQQRYNEQLQRTIELYDRWGTLGADVLMRVAAGELSLGQAAKDIAMSIARDMLNLAVKRIIMSAMTSGAEAFESQAAIPVVGPELGAAKMTESIATVMALLGSLPSARGGWWDTGSYEGLMWIHQRERVLSAPEAEQSRREGRGDSITVNALDAQSFERVLANSESEFNRWDRKRRRGRRSS